MKFIDSIAKLLGHKCPEPLTYYDKKIKEFAFKPLETGKVMLIGDSITEGWCQHPDIMSPDILNYGISGDTTVGVLGRIQQIINAKPRKVILNIGTNDIGFGIGLGLSERYVSIITKIKHSLPECEIFICSIRLTNPLHKNYISHNMMVKTFNHFLITLTSGYSGHGIKYVDVNNVLAPSDILLNEYTTDGLHLSKQGYEVEYTILKNYLS